MQPYFMPYIGYWSLIDVCDAFIYYDDASYRKQGWINRNFIDLMGKKHLFTIHTLGASSYKKINDILLGGNLKKVHKLIQSAYSKSPYFNDLNKILSSIFTTNEKNLSRFIVDANSKIWYLKIKTKIYLSSQLDRDRAFEAKRL